MPNEVTGYMRSIENLAGQKWNDLEELRILHGHRKWEYTRAVLAQMLTHDEIGHLLDEVVEIIHGERYGMTYRSWWLLNLIVEVNSTNGGGAFGGRDVNGLYKLLDWQAESAQISFVERLYAWRGSHEPLPEDIIERLRDIRAVTESSSVPLSWKDGEIETAAELWQACADQVKKRKLFG